MPSDSEIIDAFDRVEQNAPLPREGPCSFFYEELQDPGSSVILQQESSIIIFHFNFEDRITLIEGRNTGWHIEINDEAIILALIIDHEEGAFPLFFTFKQGDRKTADLLSELKRQRRITVCFLSLLFGDIYREKCRAFQLPDHIIEQFPL